MSETSNVEQLTRLDGVLIDSLYAAQQGFEPTNNQVSYENEQGSRRRLTRYACEELARGWLGKRVTTLYPDEATRKWTELTFDGKEKDKLDNKEKKLIVAFKAYEDNLDVRPKFNVTDKYANIYGGAGLVLNIDDGRSPDKPVDKKNIKTIEGAYELDSLDIRPDWTGQNPSDDPEFYQLLVSSESAEKLQKLNVRSAGYTKIHKSRIIRFDGSWLPARVLRSNDGWGDPLLIACLTDLVNYEKVGNAMATMLQDHTILLHKMKGLRTLLQKSVIGQPAPPTTNDPTATGTTPQVQGIPQPMSVLSQQFRAMKLMMRLMGAVSVDSEDEITYLTRNYQGLPDMMDRFRDKLTAATDIPYTILFGRGPTGLAAGGTGDAEEKVWSSKVNNYQETNYRYKKLDRVYEYIWLAKDGPTKGELPDNWGYHFAPLVQPTELEKEQILLAREQAQAAHVTTLVSLITSGSLTAEEVRNSLYGKGEFSYDVTLDQKSWDAQKKLAEDQQKQALQQQQDQQQQYQQQQDQQNGGDDYFGGDQQQQNQDSTAIDRIYLDASTRFVDIGSPFAKVWIETEKKKLAQK
jgi:hypothetical protein